MRTHVFLLLAAFFALPLPALADQGGPPTPPPEPAAPAAPEAPAADTFTIDDRNFKIPIRVDPARRDSIHHLLLLVSSDQGKTWTATARVPPTEPFFTFSAPADGLYWFSVQVVFKDMSREPADVAKALPAQKVRVDTRKHAREELEAEAAALRDRLERIERRLAELKESKKQP